MILAVVLAALDMHRHDPDMEIVADLMARDGVSVEFWPGHMRGRRVLAWGSALIRDVGWTEAAA